MQLFILDYDPQRATGMLCDVHLRKMCLETAQILSGVLMMQKISPVSGMPKPYNIRHPVIMAINNVWKINWVILYNHSLHDEYFRRFAKYHAYYKLAEIYRKLLFTPGIPDDWQKLTFFRDFKNVVITEPDTVKAYRTYYRHKKSVLKKWNYTNSLEPEWLTVF